MNNDKYVRLKEIGEKLAETVIHDANPDNWAGTGKASKDMTQAERGDAYWSRKLAAASLSVLVRVYSVTGMVERAVAGTTEPLAGEPGETDLEKEVAAAERTANAILERVAKASRARSN